MGRRPRIPRVPVGEGPKSTLRNHSFPPFYACYLLRSLKTTRSKATYVGSTPHPPRRLRQHNGEIAAGASRTRKSRPWVMTMNVHGFPSKLAALQFEWAWQHPDRSRNLRDEFSNSPMLPLNMKSTLLRSKIQVVRNMLTVAPYNTWPLRVKLYTSEALKHWRDIDVLGPPLPRGFSHTVELEGVDGKSGILGSGRDRPIDVTDGPFTIAQTSKYNQVTDVAPTLPCSVCQELIDLPSEDPITVAICPHSNCTTISHLRCLGSKFLADEQGSASSSSLSVVPRGGECSGCGEWTLWGDIVRAAYRRQKGGLGAVEEEAKELSAEDDLEESDGDSVSERSDASSRSTRSKGKGKAVSVMTDASPRKRGRPRQNSSEHLPLAKISRGAKLPTSKIGVLSRSSSRSSAGSLEPVTSAPRPRGRPRTKDSTSGVTTKTAAKAKVTNAKRLMRSQSRLSSSSVEILNGAARPRGRPRSKPVENNSPTKALTTAAPKPSSRSKVSTLASKSKPKTARSAKTARPVQSADETSIEVIDVRGIV